MDKGKVRILVVDDEEAIRGTVSSLLEEEGYEVTAVSSGEEALARFGDDPFPLVITDILMPRLDGYALVHRLRSNPKTADIPIIFLSATYVTPEDRAFAMRLGVARFLEKPVETEEFLLTVAEVLTQEPAKLPEPLDDQQFNRGYRDRLENKLRHKIGQIQRTERLLKTLPEDQKPAFRTLLA